VSTVRLFVAERDITELRVDAIVNSADPVRLGRGGLNGQIHQVAGPRLLRASRALRGQAAGSVKLTLGYGLPARYVLHTIVPTAHGPTAEEQDLLAECYRRCLTLASQRRFGTVVFPVLGSGHCGFPFRLAATIALTEIQRYLEHDAILGRVIVTIYDDRGYDLSNLAKELLGYYMDEGWELAGAWDSPLHYRLAYTGKLAALFPGAPLSGSFAKCSVR
jgi:O-acetyl-ADP-ribose deacetylase (regulator of RNase III)